MNPYQPRSLKQAQRDRDPSASYAEHDRKTLVSDS
jgi:hypothetical protein